MLGGNKMRLGLAILTMALASLLLGACGGSNSSGGGGSTGLQITISNLTYSPAALGVPQGGTVTVVNNDAVQHSVTSEATQGSYTLGGVAGVSFDTGLFSGTKTFVIPANAPVGTKVWFFCSNHKAMMNGGAGDAGNWIMVAPAGSGGGGY